MGYVYDQQQRHLDDLTNERDELRRDCIAHEAKSKQQQQIITILTEALENIANSDPRCAPSDLREIAIVSIQRADKAGKGEV